MGHHVKNSDIAATTEHQWHYSKEATCTVWSLGEARRQHINMPWMSSLGTDLMPSGGDILDNHATPGYSRSTTDHWQEDSTGKLPKIVDTVGHCYRPPLPMNYDDDDDVTILSHFRKILYW